MATDKLQIGSKAPDFILPGVDGNEYSINQFGDKKGIAVIFSCNHCPYVKAYEKRMIDLQRKFARHIQFLVINSNNADSHPDDSFENMKIRSNDRGFNFPYLRDETQEVARNYDATHTPEIFLLNSERELVFHGKIDDNWQDAEQVREKYLEEAINELLAGKKISTQETFTIGCTIKWK